LKFYLIGLFFFLLTKFSFSISYEELKKENLLEVCFNTKTCFKLDHANTYQKRKQGLMFKNKLNSNEGMIFSWEKTQLITMWMKNTLIALDMIWLNSDFEIICIKENTIPFDLTPISCSKPANYVIELNAGSAKKFNLQKKKKPIIKIISE
tara:strand:+ start:292 stop:744 length:453 start_codon:yes stop_codon:yes gene_type:complete